MFICYSHGDEWLAELAERFVLYADTQLILIFELYCWGTGVISLSHGN